MKLVLRPYVEQDLDEASHWYEERRQGLRQEFLEVVEGAFSRIKGTPRLYPTVHADIRRAPLPRFPYGIYYALIDGAIHVLAIVHDARHPSIWRGRR